MELRECWLDSLLKRSDSLFPVSLSAINNKAAVKHYQHCRKTKE